MKHLQKVFAPLFFLVIMVAGVAAMTETASAGFFCDCVYPNSGLYGTLTPSNYVEVDPEMDCVPFSCIVPPE